MTFEIIPLSGSIGAEITGIDIEDINEQIFPSINETLLNYGVIYFRNQDISPDQQLSFARRWNELHIHPYLSGLENHPEIIEIVKEPEDPNNFGDHWHTDQIFTPIPAMATMLYAKEVPPVGGDTMFACMEHAFEALSPGMKNLASRLLTFNRYNKKAPRSNKMSSKIPDPEKPSIPAIHPLVRRHPETGRPSLYMTATETTPRFDGMTCDESLPLINYLLRHATKPEFTCRLNWELGTLGIWDNRRVMHMALNDYPGHRRVMHRITIKGTRPIGLRDGTFLN